MSINKSKDGERGLDPHAQEFVLSLGGHQGRYSVHHRRQGQTSGKSDDSGADRTGTAKAKKKKKPRRGPTHRGEASVGWKTLGRPKAKEEEAKSETPPSNEEQHQEDHTCLLCCEPMNVVSFGECNHRASCEKCCLRLRMCYNNMDCPMCKQELREIVLAPCRANIPPFNAYKKDASLSSRITKQLGPGVVMVDSYHEIPGASRLLQQLLNMVKIQCPLCYNTVSEKKSSRIKNNTQLIEHIKSQHRNAYICKMCLEEGRVFTIDQEIFSSRAALQQHTKASHPVCRFCNKKSFYDSDALWYHLIQHHFRCQLCDQESDGKADAWYRNAAELQLHLANDHFACENEQCRACLVAFTSLEELQRHHLDHHSGRMRRWDQSQSRPLVFDMPFVNRRHGATQSMNTGRRTFQREARGGLEVIDDDLGMLSLNADTPSASTHFPTLGEASSNNNNNNNTTARSHPKLVSHHVTCPCGRRKTSHVIPEGDPIPKLECDGICRLEGRKDQLDDAFGIDRRSHLSVFNRRKVTWTNGTLLKAAKADVETVKEFENILEDFMRSSSSRRQLAPSPRSHRMMLHGMAEQYGIATASTGQEPRRAIQLFKPPSASIALPDPLLSSICVSVPDTEIDAMIKASQGFQVQVTNIAPSVNLHDYLRHYNPDHYKITWDQTVPRGEQQHAIHHTNATISFDQESLLKDFLSSIGGGIRGLFTINNPR
jgi:hypothetical protein